MANILSQIEKTFSNYLQLNERIIGITFINAPEAFDACDFGDVKGSLYYCYMVKLASQGKELKATVGQFACETASKILGLEPYYSDADGVKGWEAIHIFNSNKLAAEKHNQLKQSLIHPYGVGVAPLGSYSDMPDVVMVIANPYQAMRLLQGYHYFSSQNKSISMSGMCGVCYESTVLPFIQSDLNISMLCSGTRFVCKWREDSLIVSFPGNLLKPILDGIIKTADPCELDSKKELINKLFELEHENRLKKEKQIEKENKLNLGNSYFYKSKVL